jgi:hypothetical protein
MPTSATKGIWQSMLAVPTMVQVDALPKSSILSSLCSSPSPPLPLSLPPPPHQSLTWRAEMVFTVERKAELSSHSEHFNDEHGLRWCPYIDNLLLCNVSAPSFGKVGCKCTRWYKLVLELVITCRWRIPPQA